MQYEILEKKVLSSNGKNMLAGRIYLPNGEIKGYFHIVHGMTEYIGRYDKFMRILAENGYIALGYDHLGHGNTANDDSELGFIAEHNGDDLLARDVKVFADAMKSEYGHYPYYLMGHSMGSFVVRMAVKNYITPDKLIIMGTGGPKGIVVFGLYLSKFIQKIRGPKHYSKLVRFLAFGSYNARCKKSEGPHAWLTNDSDIRDKYNNDKFCTFQLTVSAMHDLISLTYKANRKEWFSNVAKKMPILLVSGKDDVVGDYSKGVIAVRDHLIKCGADVTMKLYENNRHELLNDNAREECTQDILDFIK
ncbi:MAG: alpha/beta hydrolase [Clostridia bacterium]|nr:alpha/beta hydrolase [Clostridia bacterium]